MAIGSMQKDFNPEHPLPRTECMKYRARMFNWARNNLGIVGTEDGADWVVPYVDYTSVGNEGACVPVPLYNLVYHDAIITQSGGFEDPVRCILNAGYVQIDAKFDLEVLKVVTTLQKRVGLLEMIDHEFLKDSYRKERTTFSDGTTITVDRDAGTWEIDPPLLIDGKERGKGAPPEKLQNYLQFSIAFLIISLATSLPLNSLTLTHLPGSRSL